MFGISGASLAGLKYIQNGWKRPRFSLDQWDRQSKLLIKTLAAGFAYSGAVMERDMRLTGFLRGQTDNVKAPAGFELNNPWKVSEWLSACWFTCLHSRIG